MERVESANLEAVNTRLKTAENALRAAGVCMSCWGGFLPSGDPNGCTDCLNTGFSYGQPDLRWRREIVAFADLMERELRENDHKGGWAAEHYRHLFHRMQEETDELALAIYARIPWSRVQYLKDPDPVLVGSEAADIANFAMMIADVCGALRIENPRAQK